MPFPLLALSRPQELHLGDGGPEESKRGREGWDGMGSEGNIRVRSTIMSHPPPRAQLRTRRMVLQGLAIRIGVKSAKPSLLL